MVGVDLVAPAHQGRPDDAEELDGRGDAGAVARGELRGSERGVPRGQRERTGVGGGVDGVVQELTLVGQAGRVDRDRREPEDHQGQHRHEDRDGTCLVAPAVPGGLAYAVIVVGAMLGAITGTVAASVIAMGVISLPVMMRYGYNMRLATGVIAASGTITQLIPPSLVLIVLADQLGQLGRRHVCRRHRPVASLQIAAVPALHLRAVDPPAARRCRRCRRRRARCAAGRSVRRCCAGMVPSLVLIFLVLGTIFIGLATPTEAGAMGVVGAMVLAALQRPPDLDAAAAGMATTMRITSMVVFILIGSTVFSLVFQGMDGGTWIEHLLTGLPGGAIGFLIFVNIFIFVLAFFLDFFEIAFIVVPLLAPVADDARHRPRLVRRAALRQHADQLHASALRLRAVLPARHRAAVGARARTSTGAPCPGSVLQLILVAIVIFWPQSVTYWLDNGPKVDPNRSRSSAASPRARTARARRTANGSDTQLPVPRPAEDERARRTQPAPA